MEQKFTEWVAALSKKYRQAQIKAHARVNSTLIEFYFELGKEITSTSFKNTYGSKFYEKLSKELKEKNPQSEGFAPRNLRYIESFYTLYSKILPQVVAKFKNAFSNTNTLQEISGNESLENTNLSGQIINSLSMVPWGHHRSIIDVAKGDIEKALFYVFKTIENNWSRSMLDLFISSNLYERQGIAINNFALTLPEENGDLVKELTKDPYVFDFTEMTKDYNEKQLKQSVVDRIETSLLEIGKGFAFVGKECRLDVGESEFYIDLLLYYIPEHFYVVVEFKNTKFKPEYLGQLSFYVTAVDHKLKGKKDNKTVGMLICKDKDNVVAQYSVENYNIPVGISSFELSKYLTEKFKSDLKDINEIEKE